VGGFICCVGGGPTAWESKKKVDQALSSVESEYMALFRAVREVVWQRRLLAELGEEQQGPTPLYCDSQGAITLAKNPVLHGLTKHMRVLQRFGFQFSSPQPTPLSIGQSLLAPPSDESVQPSGPYPKLVGCLMYLMTCIRPDLAYPLSLLARYVAPGRHRNVHLDVAKRVLRYLCSMSGMGLVLGGRGPVVLIGHADASRVDDSAMQPSSQGYTFSLGAMAAQELRWLTYLLIDLGEQPRSPLVLYVDNKAMIALCQEHRLEHRTKHIALRYFLTRELQQRGQLRLAYMPTRANTADIFTKALPPACFAFIDWSCDHLLDHGDHPHLHDLCPCAPFSVALRGSLRRPPAEPLASCLLAKGFTDQSLDLVPWCESWKSTGTYVDAVSPLGANVVDGMWIFKVKRSPVFKARNVATSFSQYEEVDFF
ncbi:unnamed protein product, partial [Closterium sp. NIES-53]